MGIVDKVKDMLGSNKGKAKHAVDTGADKMDSMTGRKHSDKIDTGAEKAKDAVDKLPDDDKGDKGDKS